MRLIFHGKLRDLFGPEAVMQADTVADAIEGFSRQTAWPREMVVDAVGFDTEEKLAGPADEVHMLPAMMGGGGKFGTILLGAAIIGLAFIPGLQGAAFLVGTLHASLVVAGAMMILQGVMGVFMKSPKMKSTNDPEASKYLAVNKNTTAIGTPISMAWGRTDMAGHWLSLQSDSTNLSYGTFPANPS